MDRLDLPAALQDNPGLTRLFDKLESGPMLAAATASYNTATGHAVQVNGPVANRVQYYFHLSIHTDGGCSTFDPQRPHRTAGRMKSPGNPDTRAVEVRTTRSRGAQPECHLTTIPVSKTATPMRIYFKKFRPGAQPDTVLATSAPNVQGNWIASRIVRRFGLKHCQDKTHRIVPLQSATSTDKEKTRLYVDLACGGVDVQDQASPCRHRFFIVNDFAYDVLLEATESSSMATGVD